MSGLPEILAKARAQLVIRAPFFGSITLGLIWVEAPEIGTMATDGRHLIYNPAWVIRHGVDAIIGVIAHEVLHVVNLHHLRRAGRHLKLWNIAADLMINRVLLADGFTLPSDLIEDKTGEFKGLPVETIYARLVQQQAAQARQVHPQPNDGPSQSGTGSAEGEGGDSDFRPPGEGADTKPSGGGDDTCQLRLHRVGARYATLRTRMGRPSVLPSDAPPKPISACGFARPRPSPGRRARCLGTSSR
jgi:hypothetical protein